MMNSAESNVPKLSSKPAADERRWVFVYATVVMLVTMMPYVLAYFVQGDMKFTGAVLGVEDMNSYIAKMLNGSSGD